MESSPESSGFSSLQQLLDELATLIADIASCQDNAWVKNTELDNRFRAKYGVSIATALNAQVSGSNLRNLFIHCRSQRFRIHEAPQPQEFYVRVLDEVTPGDNSDPRVQQSQQHSEYQPIVLPDIQSISDFEFALIELIKSLTVSEEFTTLAMLSNKFRDCYGQPIRSIKRDVCLDMQLSELLQTIPTLHVQKIDNDWLIWR